MLSKIYARIQQRRNLRRIAGHGAWLFGDKVLRAVVGLLVGAIVARHLGPADFGVLSLVFAYVMLLAALAGFGLDGVITRDLVRRPHDSPAILGTGFIIKLGCAIVVFAAGTFFIHRLDANLGNSWALIAVASCAIFFYALDVIDFQFQSELNGRAIVMSRSSAFVLTSGVKLVLVIIGAPLVLFAATPAIEAAVVAFFLVLLYRAQGKSLGAWRFERKHAVDFIGTALPMAISGLVVIAIMQTDKLMLGRMIDSHAVGIYSAASLLSTAWYMVPVVVGSSVAPALTQLYETNRADYAGRLQDVFSSVTFAALCVGTITALLAAPLIALVFGEAYSGAAMVLTIHVWTGLFIAHVSIRTRALLIEGGIGLILMFSAMTLAANILLNLELIDRYAETGAAFASLIAWGLSAVLFPLGSRRSRGFVSMFLRSFVPASWTRALVR